MQQTKITRQDFNRLPVDKQFEKLNQLYKGELVFVEQYSDDDLFNKLFPGINAKR